MVKKIIARSKAKPKPVPSSQRGIADSDHTLAQQLQASSAWRDRASSSAGPGFERYIDKVKGKVQKSPKGPY